MSDDFAPQIRSLYAGVDEGDEPFDPAGRAEAHNRNLAGATTAAGVSQAAEWRGRRRRA